MNPAPLDLETVLSPDWLTRALDLRHPGTRVAAASVVETILTIASKVRFSVHYDSNPHALPEALCAKGYFAPESRGHAALGAIEARFYRDLAPALDVNLPPCLYAGLDPQSQHGVVLMADLVARGARFLTALSPYSVEQVVATLEQLARLHAAGWSDPTTRNDPWLAPRLSSYPSYVSVERLQQLLDDGRAQDLEAPLRDAGRVRKAFLSLVEHASARSDFIIHADAHAGNLFVASDGAPGLIDWQMVQRGPWALDVAYHIGAVLEVDIRERHERELLNRYLEILASRGVPAPKLSEAWDAYREALAYGYFLWAITQRVETPVVKTFVRRLGSAVARHETMERLERA